MERYVHLQSLPNSPLTPLTPLSENPHFEFNFGGDGSLDVYIDDVRHKHRAEQQEEKLKLQQPPKRKSPMKTLVPKRYSESFLKIREVFSPHGRQGDAASMPDFQVPIKRHVRQQPKIRQSPKMPAPRSIDEQYMKTPGAAVKIVRTNATPQKLHQDYMATPTNVRVPLKQRNHNVNLTLPQKIGQLQQQLHEQNRLPQTDRRKLTDQSQHTLHFRQSSPVAIKPLCPHISEILQQRGLSMYGGLFQMQEIDLFSFKLLKLHDLQQMGLTNAKHCDIIMADVAYARQYL